MLAMLGIWVLPLLVGGWIFLMVNKKGWSWTQIIGGALLMVALSSALPQLPIAVSDGMNGIVNAVTK